MRDNEAVYSDALPADPAALAPARHALRAWLTAGGLPAEDVQDVLIAAGEACANAIEHGYRGAGPDKVLVHATFGVDRLEIVVSDRGTWRPPPLDRGTRGHGRRIMEQLMDKVTVEGGAGGTTVRLVKDLPPA
ncbi:ATP-binding protein [Amycolatopsis sp. 195334CR]|uniref:ATP-binding protein n=1 Tax=Amycolatopsis sp. 195334CR TaxID=2814588 RepID=UPI001A902EBA|nr:ATP-binding protein [Amycolatopsis sp. 195334CR]MBN6036912.1 ATP-binding protein [Amycolatopsis sp. 195334CR]